MMFKTHLVFSLLVSLLAYSYFDINVYLFILICVLAGTLPDIDHPKSKVSIPVISNIINFFFGHRKLFHSIFFVIVLGLIIKSFFGDYYIPFELGYLSHIILDALTKQGINFIYPFKQLTVKGFIRTNGFLEKIIFIILVVLNLVVLVNFLNF